MNLSEHFTLAEFIRSGKAREMGLDNTPPDELIPAMHLTCEGLERIRQLAGHPVWLLSGYRCPELNVAVGGSKSSQHIRGEAADIICPGFGPAHEFAKFIQQHALGIKYDQLIADRNTSGFKWVHVSFTQNPRREALTMTKTGLLVVGIV